MSKPKIDSQNWVMTLTLEDGSGEQFWEVIPKKHSRPCVIHVQKSGLIYLSILRGPELIDKAIVADALRCICRMVYEKGTLPWINIKPKRKGKDFNALLFGIAKSAGLRKPIHGKGSHLAYVVESES